MHNAQSDLGGIVVLTVKNNRCTCHTSTHIICIRLQVYLKIQNNTLRLK